MRFFAVIVVIGAIVFFAPKTYTIHPGDVSRADLEYFKRNKKKCLGVNFPLEMVGKNNSKQALCAGLVSKKDYVDLLDELSKK